MAHKHVKGYSLSSDIGEMQLNRNEVPPHARWDSYSSQAGPRHHRRGASSHFAPSAQPDSDSTDRSPQMSSNAQENPTKPSNPFKNHALSPSFPLALPQFPRFLRQAPAGQGCTWDLPQEPSTSSCPVFVFQVGVCLPFSPSTQPGGFKGLQ